MSASDVAFDSVRGPKLRPVITLQPIRKVGFEAVVLFSDILVVPEALGLPA